MRDNVIVDEIWHGANILFQKFLFLIQLII